MNCETGKFQPPAEEVHAVEYPKDKGDSCDGTLTRVHDLEFDAHVLVSPIFVDPGVKIRVLVGEASKPTVAEHDASGDDSPSFTVDATETENFWSKSEIWWVKGGQSIQVYLGGGFDKSRSGVAAVFIYGKYVKE